jgi:hypothetical protein
VPSSLSPSRRPSSAPRRTEETQPADPKAPQPETIDEVAGCWCTVEMYTPSTGKKLSGARRSRYVQICGGRDTGYELLVFPSEPRPPAVLVPPCDTVPLLNKTGNIERATVTRCRLAASKYAVELEVIKANSKCCPAAKRLSSESSAGEYVSDNGEQPMTASKHRNRDHSSEAAMVVVRCVQQTLPHSKSCSSDQCPLARPCGLSLSCANNGSTVVDFPSSFLFFNVSYSMFSGNPDPGRHQVKG